VSLLSIVVQNMFLLIKHRTLFLEVLIIIKKHSGYKYSDKSRRYYRGQFRAWGIFNWWQANSGLCISSKAASHTAKWGGGVNKVTLQSVFLMIWDICIESPTKIMYIFGWISFTDKIRIVWSLVQSGLYSVYPVQMQLWELVLNCILAELWVILILRHLSS